MNLTTIKAPIAFSEALASDSSVETIGTVLGAISQADAAGYPLSTQVSSEEAISNAGKPYTRWERMVNKIRTGEMSPDGKLTTLSMPSEGETDTATLSWVEVSKKWSKDRNKMVECDPYIGVRYIIGV